MADQEIADGNIQAGRSAEHCLRQMSRFYDCKALTISGESGDVVIATKYPGMDLVNIFNVAASAATVIFKTLASGGSAAAEVTTKIASYNCNAFQLPPVYSLTKTGTSDSLILLFQKR